MIMKKTMIIRRLCAALLGAAAMLGASQARCQEVRIVNSLGDFERFLAQASGKDFPQQEVLWREFEARYPGIYEDIVFPRSDPDWRARRIARLKTSFARMPEMAPHIVAMMRRADAIANGQAALFRKVFPDLQPGTSLVFIPLSTFNVAARPTAYGPFSLVVGVDYILQNHDVLDSLFAHEFFHVYHFGKLKDRPHGSTMASPLWIEGFATFVSAQLNPTVAAVSILMDPALAAACTPDNVRRWASDYRAIVRQDADRADLQAAWFRMTTPEPLARRGYCLGLHVARLLAEATPMQTMATWDETVYQPKIEAALDVLAGQAPQ